MDKDLLRDDTLFQFNYGLEELILGKEMREEKLEQQQQFIFF